MADIRTAEQILAEENIAEQETVKVYKYRLPQSTKQWQIYEHVGDMIDMLDLDLRGTGAIDWDDGRILEIDVGWMTRRELDNLPEFEGY